uniref:Retrovirus-related Pol polyprotein from transposon TNT 1-94 n=1 Tax=Tanacetum cinerariifolium TaxID=118510 RepID=A0A699IT65_TANCI|nr:retrovirus-related Pol polyprotein from transposon TNT 1-94 [Tanacetum cinerariifolium]
MPLGGHFKLSLKNCPIRGCDVERMNKVPYANAVGSLMYLMMCTRPDIAYAVSIVSRYLANPGKNHWEAVKWILKYLRGTANVGLVYGTNRDNHMDVIGFVDSDYAKDSDKEAEYMALTEAMKEAIWLKGLLEELGVELNRVTVNCDNQGAIHLSRNHVFHERTRHINVRYHFIREVLEAKIVKVLKVGTEHNVADALTKVAYNKALELCGTEVDGGLVVTQMVDVTVTGSVGTVQMAENYDYAGVDYSFLDLHAENYKEGRIAEEMEAGLVVIQMVDVAFTVSVGTVQAENYDDARVV